MARSVNPLTPRRPLSESGPHHDAAGTASSEGQAAAGRGKGWHIDNE
jgi:hypothetical protein